MCRHSKRAETCVCVRAHAWCAGGNLYFCHDLLSAPCVASQRRPGARTAPATEFKHTTACSDVEGPGGFYPGPENGLNTDFEKE